MRCPLAQEELAAVYGVDRKVGIGVKYLLVPVTALAAWGMNPGSLQRPGLLAGLAFFALGTGALHLGYVRWKGRERFLVTACAALEAFFVALASRLLNAPLEVLIAIPTLKAVQLAGDFRDRLRTVSLMMAVLLGATALWSPARLGEPPFLWGVLSAGTMIAFFLVLCHCMKCQKCSACEANRMYGVLLHKLVNAQEEERRRIARDLHDSRSQDLTALIINLDLLQQSLPDEMAAAQGQVERIKDMANSILEDVHRLIYELRPIVLDDLGLEPAIRWYVRNTIEPVGIHTRIKTEGLEERRYPPQLETAVFRIVQEALTNIVRYARARNVTITLNHTGNRLKAAVCDDGAGFDVQSVLAGTAGRESFGLMGMQERVLLLGGQINIDSSPGQGSRIDVEFPVVNYGIKTHLDLVSG